MSEMINPYIAGAPVTETRMFFGRDDVFDWIQNSLSGRYADHILVIHGQRRVGKTSVLKQLGNRLPDKYIPVFFDLQGRTHTTLDRFLWWLAREIVRVLKQEQNVIVPVPEKEAFADDLEYFESRFLPSLKPHIGERSLLLTFDEFDNLEESEIKEELARPLIDYLRRMMGEEGISFIFSIGSSGRKLENMQASYTEFFKTALYKKISFLSREQTAGLVTGPVEGLLEYERQAVERIFEITSGHPYFTQLTCHELFSLCQRTGELRILEKDVEAILEDVVERGTVNLKFTWDEASDLEKWSLATLAHHDKLLDNHDLGDFLRKQRVRLSESDLTSSLLHLREKDILTEENRFVIYLLKLWLRKNRTIEQVREELTEVNPIANRYIEIGQEFHDSGLYDKAIENFREALAISPDNIQAQVNIAQAYMAQEDLGQAVTEFEKALAMDDEDVASRAGLCEAYLALGDAANEKGKTREAIQSYQKVLSINAEHTEARQRMAEINRVRAEKALAVGKDEEALAAFKEALEFTPEDEELSARYEQAKVEKRTKVLASLLAKADREQASRNWEAALNILENALEIAPGEEKVQVRIRTVKSEQRKEELQAFLARADRAASAGRWGLVIAALEEYLILEPEDAKVQAQLEQARQTLRKTQIQETLARANRAVQAKQWDQAIAALEEHLAREPQEPKILERLEETRQEQYTALVTEAQARAHAFSRQERFAEAITAWNEYLKINPSDDQAVQAEIEKVHKAQTLAQNYVDAQKAFSRKNYEKAVSLLRGIVVENADYKEATRLMAEAIELRRTARKWWQNKWLWGGVVGLGVLVVAWYVFRPGSPLMASPTSPPQEVTATAPEPLAPPIPTNTPEPTSLPSPTPTSLPYAWARLNSGQFLPRDTITAIVIDPNDPGVMYVGTENAGIYKSIDGGLSWQPTHNGLERASVQTLVIDPTNPDVLYAGTLMNGVYKTINGGQTWRAVNNGIELPGWNWTGVIIMDKLDSQHLYYTHAWNIYETSDGGDNWSKLDYSGCPSWPVGLVVHPSNNQILYALEWSEKNPECKLGVYKSQDGGHNWSLSKEISKGSALAIDSQTGNHLYTSAPGELYSSIDDGVTWNLSANYYCNVIAFDPQNDQIAYCGMGSEIMTTTDGGKTWKNIKTSGFAGNSQVSSITISAQGLQKMWVGSQSLLMSNDEGKSWTEHDNGLGAGHLELKLDPGENSTFYLEMSNGWLYRSSDTGRNWTLIEDRSSELEFNATGVEMYRALGRGSLLLSPDKGDSWEELSIPDAIFVGSNPHQPGTLFAVAPQCGSEAPIYISIDNGQTWSEKSGYVPCDRTRAFFGSDQGKRVYLVGNAFFSRSDDGGETWHRCGEDTQNGTPARYGSRLTIDPRNDDRLYLATRFGGVVVSSDGCRSWQSSNNGLGSLFVNTLAIDPNNPDTIYAGTDGGAYISYDAGATWGQVNDGLLGATVVYSIVVDKDSNVYAATPYGIFKLEGK